VGKSAIDRRHQHPELSIRRTPARDDTVELEVGIYIAWEGGRSFGGGLVIG
jgi:hypothetical protein